jgi:hypothetical protein
MAPWRGWSPPLFFLRNAGKELKATMAPWGCEPPPLSHTTATATAAAAARGGSKQQGKAMMVPWLCPPPSRPSNNNGGCGARGGDGALALLVPPLPMQQHQQWRLEMERTVRPRRGWGAMAGFAVAPMTGCSMDGAPGGIGNGSLVVVCCRGGLCHTSGNVIIARGRGKGSVGRQQLCGGLNERPSNGRVGWAMTQGMNFMVASIRGFPMNDVFSDIGNGSINVICCQEGGDARQVALSSSLGEGARVPLGARGKDERRAHTHAGVVQDPAGAEPGLGIQLERTPPRRPGGQQGVGPV